MTASSRELKENITPIDNALDKISQIEGVYFNLKTGDPEDRQIGFIAEDVDQIMPELVDGDGPALMSYDRVPALTVEAIKELAQMIKELKAENEQLKAKIAAFTELEARLLGTKGTNKDK